MNQYYFSHYHLKPELPEEINKVEDFVIKHALWRSFKTLKYFNVKRALYSKTVPNIVTKPIYVEFTSDNFLAGVEKALLRYFNLKASYRTSKFSRGHRTVRTYRGFSDYSRESDSPLFTLVLQSSKKEMYFITYLTEKELDKYRKNTGTSCLYTITLFQIDHSHGKSVVRFC
jgi:hypothetical protein